MNIKQKIKEIISCTLKELEIDFDDDNIVIEIPKNSYN